MNAVLEAKEINSMADVEIGHIVYASWGYDQTNIEFFKVVRKTAAMVELQAIGQKITDRESAGMSEYVVADAENELYESCWVVAGQYSEKKIAQEKGWKIARNQEASWSSKPWKWNSDFSQQVVIEEAVKYERALISKHKAQFSNGKLFVKMASYKYASSWEGRELHQSHWA